MNEKEKVSEMESQLDVMNFSYQRLKKNYDWLSQISVENKNVRH